jgi:hypothetical protein
MEQNLSQVNLVDVRSSTAITARYEPTVRCRPRCDFRVPLRSPTPGATAMRHNDSISVDDRPARSQTYFGQLYYGSATFQRVGSLLARDLRRHSIVRWPLSLYDHAHRACPWPSTEIDGDVRNTRNTHIIVFVPRNGQRNHPYTEGLTLILKRSVSIRHPSRHNSIDSPLEASESNIPCDLPQRPHYSANWEWGEGQHILGNFQSSGTALVIQTSL